MKTALLFLFFLFSAQAVAGTIDYIEDHAYKPLGEGDAHPMAEMQQLAEEGDVRAQFILGDLYAKGHGGLPKDLEKARQWFEDSAAHGYAFSYIRLAALAKRKKDWAEAYKWYQLAVHKADSGALRRYAVNARDELVRDKKVSTEDIAQVKKDIDAWRVEVNKILAEERRLERERKKAEYAAKKAESENIKEGKNHGQN
jgi:TPR repeat protein